MSNANSSAVNLTPPIASYESLIEEAYITPIRTVIVVDDEFPSLDGLIEKELGGTRPWSGRVEDARKISEILSYCRNRERPWLVDVHDGREFSVAGEEKIAPYLHHSDLMILDYHLEGDAGTGDHAIRILRDLAKNDHFNMVIVYTKGEDGSVLPILRQIAFSLMTASSKLSAPEAVNSKVSAAIADWDDSHAGIKEHLLGFISDEIFLTIRKTQSCRQLLQSDEWNLLKTELDDAPAEVESITDLLWAKWLISEKQKQLAKQFSSSDYGLINWASGEELNWVRTDRLFVTVVNKSHAPNELTTKLQTALQNWQPSPHQLLMARMRAQMDERGVIAESGVLRDYLLQAGWMKQLFDTKCLDRKQTLKNTVDKHWESLGDNLRLDIDQYAGKIAEHLDSLGRATVFEKFFPEVNLISDEDKIIKRLNTYANMKAGYERGHLMTGHILKINGELWACLSPACDLVPGQKITGWHGRLGEYLPFLAVQLHKVSDETALKEATQNIFIFIENNSTQDCYSFCPMGKVNLNPQWEQFFAKNGGRFDESANSFLVGRLTEANSSIKFEETIAVIVGQLRYEYALNLLQRLGTNLSRVGLDFISTAIEQ